MALILPLLCFLYYYPRPRKIGFHYLKKRIRPSRLTGNFRVVGDAQAADPVVSLCGDLTGTPRTVTEIGRITRVSV